MNGQQFGSQQFGASQFGGQQGGGPSQNGGAFPNNGPFANGAPQGFGIDPNQQQQIPQGQQQQFDQMGNPINAQIGSNGPFQ